MRTLAMLLAVAIVIAMAACGGSGGGTTASTITSVTVTCSPSTIQYGQTSQCSATVMGTGSFSSAVTWTASAGSILSSGLFTAPSGGNASLMVTVTATSSQDPSKSGATAVTVNPVQQVNNVQPILADAGPPTVGAVNEPFTSVTVCVPNTTTCQTIDHILVDTGSSGLRLLSSFPGGGELTIQLPNQNDSSGNPLAECLVFLDGFTWGNVAAADITIAGEQASSVRLQVIIPSTSSPAVPKSCSSQTTGPNEGNSVSALGANGILGVGLFQQDCGQPCVSNPPPNAYYDCLSSGCNPTTVTLAQQVSNPVIFFASDNNGVLISLPAVPNGGLPTVSGSLIFGIGTQSNNALGSATVYTVSDSTGDFTTTFAGNNYPQSFIDSGSNGFFFPNATGIPVCPSPNNFWYCPSSADNLTATNQGVNGNKGTVSFTIENANTLFSNNGSNNTAFSTLGGPAGSGAASSFDWGLSFFYGRNVFTAIENKNASGVTGPYFAY